MQFDKDGRRLFTCLGRQESAAAVWHQPDRYRDLVGLNPDKELCVHGAGLSLSGAGFSATADVLGMARFNRVLDLDSNARVVHVEAGITLGRLFTALAKHDLILAVQPGHPDITVGGSIAGNVHGKNPFREGTFAGLVKELTLFHPAHGRCVLSREQNQALFDLTCGGFGLTGIILSAKLALEPFPTSGIDVTHLPADGPVEAVRILRENNHSYDQLYAWLNFSRHDHGMGRGFVVAGRSSPPIDANRSAVAANYPSLHTEDAWPLSCFNRFSLPLINAAYACVNMLAGSRHLNAFDALFPFANRIQYFHAYGRSGFVEHQVLVPEAIFPSYIELLMEILKRHNLACGLASMKLFAGERRLLRFCGDGVSLAIHLPGGPKACACLQEVDELDIEYGAIANIIKDARLSGETIRKQYGGEYEVFRHRLHEFDPKRRFVSALSERLGL